MKQHSLLEGSIPKNLIRLSVPIVLANILQAAYQLTDIFWVGRLGSTAVAAVSLSFPVVFLLISIGAGFSVAGTVLVAQYAGQKDRYHVNLTSGQTLLVMTVFSAAMTVVGYFLSPFLIPLMGGGEAMNEMAVSFLQISFLGLFFMYAYLVFQSLFRGVGNVIVPLIIVALTVLLNFLMDPLLIMGWKFIPAYGVNGAAASTVFCQGIAALLGIYLMFRGRSGIHVRWKDLKPVPKEIRRILSLGLPASAEQSTRALSMLMIMFLVTSAGVVGTAAYGVGSRVLSFVIIPALGFSLATSTMVGQNIGASQFDRAFRIARIACLIIFLTLTFVGVFLFIFAHGLMAFFVPGAPLVQQEGANFIRIISFTFGLIGIQQVSAGALRGGGQTLAAMILAMTALWVIRFPLAYVLSRHTSLGVEGVWWAFCVSNTLAAVLAWILLYQRKWLRKITEDVDPLEQQVIEETAAENPRSD